MTPEELLADAICDARLVVLTGAGLSKGLANRVGGTMPDWAEALRRVAASAGVGADLAARVELLVAPGATGADFALAASLVEDAVGADRFADELRDLFSLDPAAGVAARADDYAAVHGLAPRGIVTFNVDGAHRAVIAAGPDPSAWAHLDPTTGDDGQFAALLRGGLDRRFLLEAHGSVDTSPAFTARAYRGLFARSPAYRAFLQLVLTSHRLLVVGFSLADHDFERVLADVANAYGGRAADHVWLAPVEPGRERDYLRLAAMYGIEHHPLAGWADLAPTLQAAATRPSPRLRSIVTRSADADMEVRRAAHREARAVSPVGKRNLLRHVLAELSDDRLRDHRPHEVATTSELIYLFRAVGTVGGPDDEALAAGLLRVLATAEHSELLARGLLALEPFARPEHLPELERLHARWQSERTYHDADYPDPDDRVPVYLQKLVYEVRAKFR